MKAPSATLSAKICWLASVILLVGASALLARGPKSATTAAQVILWSESSTLGPVYYPAEAEPDFPARQAAEDLAHILGQISGHDWPVAPEPRGVLPDQGVFVGDTARARLDGVSGTGDGRPATGLSRRALLHSGDWDRTEVYLHPRRLVINGVTPEATRTGLYRFVEQELGALWAQPGEAGARLPTLGRCALREGRRSYQPDFLDRRFLLGGAMRPDQPDGLWAIHNGASRHWEFNHNLHRIFTPAVMAEQASWRAWRFGEHAKLTDVKGNGSQPNLVDPEVVAFAAAHVNRVAAENADQLTLSLSTNDSIRYDDSEATRAIVEPFQYHRSKPLYSDLVFGFMNGVAQQLDPQLTMPESALILTQLAYMWTEPPPSFPLAPNVMPYLCTDQSQWYDPEYRATDQTLIADWSEAGPRMLGVWEYYQGQPFIIPRYFPTIMAESLSFLHEHRGRGAFFSGHPNWGYDGPKYWLAGQLAWDANADADALLATYFERAYGPAAEPMTRFFAECEEAWMTQPGQGMWLKYWDDPSQFALFNESRRTRMSDYLNEAARLLQEGDESAERQPMAAMLERTVEAWRVTKAGAELYDAWRAIPYPTKGQASPTLFQVEAFQAARERFRSTDREVFNRAERFIRILDGLDPLERWRESWPSVATEHFATPVFEGDLEGGGPDTIHPDRFRRNWVTLLSHAENASVQRRVEPEPHLWVSGVDYFTVYRWLEIQPGVTGDFRIEAQLRGVISPGAQAIINLYFMDEERRHLPPDPGDRLAPGRYDDWVTLAAAGPMPAGARHVCVEVRLLDFYPEDWIEIGSIDLQYLTPDVQATCSPVIGQNHFSLPCMLTRF